MKNSVLSGSDGAFGCEVDSNIVISGIGGDGSGNVKDDSAPSSRIANVKTTTENTTNKNNANTLVVSEH